MALFPPAFSGADYTIKCNKKEKGSQESTNLVKWKKHTPTKLPRRQSCELPPSYQKRAGKDSLMEK